MARLLALVCIAVLAYSAAPATRADAVLPAPAASAASVAAPPLAPGDVVLQLSRSRQALGIAWATRSRWTHVGLVDLDRDGNPVVIEAIGHVSATPWAAFRARGRGDVLVLRARGLSPAARAQVVAEARRFLGRPYDLRFGWGDDRLYCSELVTKAFARGAHLAVGTRQRLGELHLTGLEGAIRARWGEVPRDLRLVTPASIAGDPHLQRVYEGP